MEAEDAEHHVALTHCFKPIAHARQEQRRRWNLHFDNPNLYVYRRGDERRAWLLSRRWMERRLERRVKRNWQ